MPRVDLILSDSRGEQWGVFPLETSFIPRQGEYIHYLSKTSGNAVFHVVFVQYAVESKETERPAQMIRDPMIHVEICDDDEPWLNGNLRQFAEGLKGAGVTLHQRDQRGW